MCPAKWQWKIQFPALLGDHDIAIGDAYLGSGRHANQGTRILQRATILGEGRDRKSNSARPFRIPDAISRFQPYGEHAVLQPASWPSVVVDADRRGGFTAVAGMRR
jgi:hypothetical protein